MFRHAIFRRRAGLVLLPSFRGIVSITRGREGTARMSYWVLLGACSSQAQGSSSRNLGSSCKQMENRSYSRFMEEVKWWFVNVPRRGTTDPGPVEGLVMALGSLLLLSGGCSEPRPAVSRTCKYARRGAGPGSGWPMRRRHPTDC